MKNLSTLLERLAGALHSDELFKEAVIEAVKEVTKGTIQGSDIKEKDGTLFISASPALRSEIRLKEEVILMRIKERSGKSLLRINYE